MTTRMEAVMASGESEIATLIASLAERTAQRIGPRPDEDARIIAARELKHERIGVRREGHAFVVDPENVSSFVRAFQDAAASLGNAPRLERPRFAVRFADEVDEYEHTHNAATIRSRALSAFGTRPPSLLGF